MVSNIGCQSSSSSRIFQTAASVRSCAVTAMLRNATRRRNSRGPAGRKYRIVHAAIVSAEKAGGDAAYCRSSKALAIILKTAVEPRRHEEEQKVVSRIPTARVSVKRCAIP
jgi:hypothetical protein